MMKELIIFVLILVSCVSSEAQETNFTVRDILSKQVVTISDINPISEYELNFLDTLLKDKRVVFLGEASHFDGATLKAKSEIIQYLHRHFDYEVLLLENGFFECRKAWFEIVEERDSSTGVFAFLTKVFGTHISENTKELYRYIGKQAQTERPLEIGGIDIFESSIYQNTIKEDCETLLRKITPDFDKSKVNIHFKKTFKPKRKNKKGKYDLEQYMVSCQFLIKELLKVKEEDFGEELKRSCIFMAKTLENKTASLEWENNKPKRRKKNGKVLADYFTLRDKQMGENILWYLDTFYPNKKIIISASTYHVSRNLDQIRKRPFFLGKDAVPMGQFVWDKYKDQMYSIAFVFHHGERGEIKIPTDPLYSKVPPRGKNNLESILHSMGYKYGFLNLQNNVELNEILRSICLTPTYNKPIKTDWSKIYDGLFYIDEMHTDNWFYLEGRSGIKQPY